MRELARPLCVLCRSNPVARNERLKTRRAAEPRAPRASRELAIASRSNTRSFRLGTQVQRKSG